VAAANAFAPEFIADYNRRFARSPRSEHDAHRPLQATDDLARIFSWQEIRLVSKSLPLNYKRVLYVLDPNEAARAARGQRIRIEEREDGSLSFWHGESALPATAFPKEHGVQHGEVVENKRLSEVMDAIKERQREHIEAKAAKPSTTLRKARSAARRSSSAELSRLLRRGQTLTDSTGNRTFLSWRRPDICTLGRQGA
jgi:hypothetical protein